MHLNQSLIMIFFQKIWLRFSLVESCILSKKLMNVKDQVVWRIKLFRPTWKIRLTDRDSYSEKVIVLI